MSNYIGLGEDTENKTKNERKVIIVHTVRE